MKDQNLKIKSFAEALDELSQEKNWLYCAELFLNSATDLELFNFLANYYPRLSYDDSFSRPLAASLINLLPPEQLTGEGQKLLQAWLKIYIEPHFVFAGQDLVGMFGLQEMEPRASARLLIDLRGSKTVKSKSAIFMLRHWVEVYSNTVLSLGYKALTVSAISEAQNSLIQAAQKRGLAFIAAGCGEFRRWGGELLVERLYFLPVSAASPNGE